MPPAKKKYITIRARNIEDLRKKIAENHPSHVIAHTRELTKIFHVELRPRRRG